MNQEHHSWTLTDDGLPLSMRTGTETVSIENEEQLKALLEMFAQGLPRDFILESPLGELLFVGLGGPAARVLHYGGPGSDTGVIAKPPLTFHEPAFFPGEGQASRTDPEYLMPPETAIQIVLDFYRTGQLPSWIEWEEE